MNQTECLHAPAKQIFPSRPVAYFSMEYGFHKSLPIYSGGLGVLSGDHVKTASDLNLAFVAVGLLYKHGYFRQMISREGEQRVEYDQLDFTRMPLLEVEKNDAPLMVAVEFPGRIVYARVWKALVGRVNAYFLDTDIQENSPNDRQITSQLYGGGKQMRIEQEIILGIGGIRTLEELNISPSVYHLNEGHSAFLILERLINLIKYENLDIDTAHEVIKASTIFTTHTPVPAGNETFDMPLLENYLRFYVESNKISWREFTEMGHMRLHDSGPFEMTVLALKNTYKRNGVSALHGKVSRSMWSSLWDGFPQEEVPIFSITNGVHAQSWLVHEIKELISRFTTISLNEALLAPEELKKIYAIPNHAIWNTHLNLKNRLYEIIKTRITENWTREGEDPSLLDAFLGKINPSALTIGFARRFATYKRPTLIMQDIERLKRILSGSKTPVQLVFAGKPHPADRQAADLLRDLVVLSKTPDFLGKIIFVENYDIEFARRLVSGVDVWLNNPRRPLEASGTSGQKAGMNGAINFSVLDGWWDEGYDGLNGWIIGSRAEYKNLHTQDIIDSENLYDCIEKNIIPTYYSRSSSGIPELWTEKMKHSMVTVMGNYNTHRMLRDYVDLMYIPTARQADKIHAENFRLAREISAWKKHIAPKFANVHIKNISVKGIHGDHININEKMMISAEIEKNRLQVDEMKVELVLALEKTSGNVPENSNTQDRNYEYLIMNKSSETEKSFIYTAEYTALKTGKFSYGVRILPCSGLSDDMIDMNLACWG